jgi:predicted RNase H-like HicB family nuclease
VRVQAPKLVGIRQRGNARSARPSRRSTKTTDACRKLVEWSEEDGGYLGKCPDLISGIHGDDPVKLYAELTELVEEVIDHFEETGRPPPPPAVRPMREAG